MRRDFCFMGEHQAILKIMEKKAPLCKGGWQKSVIFDWGIVLGRL